MQLYQVTQNAKFKFANSKSNKVYQLVHNPYTLTVKFASLPIEYADVETGLIYKSLKWASQVTVLTQSKRTLEANKERFIQNLSKAVQKGKYFY